MRVNRRSQKWREQPGDRRAAHKPQSVRVRGEILTALDGGSPCHPEMAAALLASDEILHRRQSIAKIVAAVASFGRTW